MHGKGKKTGLNGESVYGVWEKGALVEKVGPDNNVNQIE